MNDNLTNELEYNEWKEVKQNKYNV